MIELIATAGLVGGPLFALGWHAKGPMQANIIKRLRKSNAELHDSLRIADRTNSVQSSEIAQLRASQERMAGNISRLADERNEAIGKLANARQLAGQHASERDAALEALRLAGKPDQKRDPKTGRWLPKPDADGWIKWAGGECPLPDGTPNQVRFRDGTMSTSIDRSPETWSWDHDNRSYDIIAYRIADKPARKTVKVIGSGVEA